MGFVIHVQDPPALHEPVLVAAFAGWNDAGEAATGALESLHNELDATLFAELDPEEFFDFQVNRPHVHTGEAGVRQLEWPTNRLSWAPLPDGRHVVLLQGTEPSLRWRSFVDGVLDLAGGLGIRRVVTLGALQVDVPHTRPVPITAAAADPALAKRVGLRRSSYEGPTGITGVLSHMAHRRGLESASVWAGVPHYLAGASYLSGALALAERVTELLDVELSLAGLAREAVVQRDEIAELVADDDDLAEYVSELEERNDDVHLEEAEPEVDPGALADEVERFLRDREG